MPWFPELSMARAISDRLEHEQAEATHRLGFYEGILGADVETLASSFTEQPLIDDPRVGRVEGLDAFEQYLTETKRWLGEISTGIDPVLLTKAGDRSVEEVSIRLSGDHPELPVAIVTDFAVNGLINAIRVYHSSWPLTGDHLVRSPLLQRDETIELSGAPAQYQRGLAAGDREMVLDAFEPDAEVREPSGGPYRYRGVDHEKIYDLMFANEGGIPLEFCTVTDDGTACAIEYNCTQWGKDAIPPQAGVAVYVRGASGRLSAARIYDDVTPPESSDSSIDNS
jgi:hypothetical protein